MFTDMVYIRYNEDGTLKGSSKENTMECKVCMYDRQGKCSYGGDRSNPDNPEECPNFDYSCGICCEIGFKHFDCVDCDLSEEEYWGEDWCE